MADDDDGTRQPPQAYDTVAPAGVGATTTNQVSPGTMQDIFFTGDQSIIDQALDDMGVDDLTAFLESLPSPSTLAGAAPAGVGSQASHTPSSAEARTLHRGSPCLSSSGARTPASHVSVRLAAAGAGGGSGGSGGSRRSTPGDDQDEDEAEADDPDVLNPLPPCHGPHPVVLNKPHPEEHPHLAP